MPVIIAQPDRVLLHRQIAKHGSVLHGDVLDVGAGRYSRYRALCTNVRSWKTLDTDAKWQPDIVASAEAMPVPDASFDGVLCTQVLEHVAHPQAVIREIFRVLKPGGRCLLTAPQWTELHEVPHDYFRYTRYGLETLCVDAGFRIDIMEQRGKYHAFMAQARIRHWIDTYHPYENTLAMGFFAPLSMLLTRYALWREGMCHRPACALETIGWCMVALKP